MGESVNSGGVGPRKLTSTDRHTDGRKDNRPDFPTRCGGSFFLYKVIKGEV